VGRPEFAGGLVTLLLPSYKPSDPAASRFALLFAASYERRSVGPRVDLTTSEKDLSLVRSQVLQHFADQRVLPAKIGHESRIAVGVTNRLG